MRVARPAGPGPAAGHEHHPAGPRGTAFAPPPADRAPKPPDGPGRGWRIRHPLTGGAVLLLTAATMGPYTTIPGVRFEQIAGYGLLLIALLVFALRRPRLPPAVWLIGLLIVAQAAIALLGTIGPPVVGITPRDPRPGLDNILLPLAVLVAGSVLAAVADDVDGLLRIAARGVLYAMCGNAVLAYVSTLTDLSEPLTQYWTGREDGISVAALAETNSRFSGVFNHPAEAGLAYGFALLAALYLYRRKPVRLSLVAAVLTVGGLLAASKIFLLVAVPVAVWQAVRSGRTLRWVVLVVAALAVTTTLLTRAGQGSEYLLNPSENSDGVFDLYTAGRFGPRSTLYGVVELVLRTSPWLGFGAGGVEAAYDNGWVEALVVSGLIGATIYTAILVILLVTGLRAIRRAVDPQATRLYTGLVLILAAGSFGIPALTANRAATFGWLLVSLLLNRLMPRPQNPPHEPVPPTPSPPAARL